MAYLRKTKKLNKKNPLSRGLKNVFVVILLQVLPHILKISIEELDENDRRAVVAQEFVKNAGIGRQNLVVQPLREEVGAHMEYLAARAFNVIEHRAHHRAHGRTLP